MTIVQKPIGVSNAEHYTWGGMCDGWHLVRSEGLSVIEERMPPDTQEQRHFHTHARQFFYVLAGELTLEVEGQVHRIAAGQGIEVAPGERHQAMNPAHAGAEVRFLVISAPPAQGDRSPA
jgi:quercetin dioxygenase-like cupin family protein